MGEGGIVLGCAAPGVRTGGECDRLTLGGPWRGGRGFPDSDRIPGNGGAQGMRWIAPCACIVLSGELLHLRLGNPWGGGETDPHHLT